MIEAFKQNWYLFAGMSIIITMSILLVQYNTEKGDLLLENFDLELVGVITDKTSIGQYAGLLYLDVLYSNKAEYDKRDSEHVYSCVIKKDKAELIVSSKRDYKIGDVVSLSSNPLLIFNQTQNVKKPYTLPNQDPLFYYRIRLHHEL